MSDGPHRSLGLRKAWKELARLADNLAYAQEEVRHAATVAISHDFNEVSGPLLKALEAIFHGHGNSLGSIEIALQQLNEARRLAAGSVFGINAVFYSEALVSAGRLEPNAFYKAIGMAARMRGRANILAVQEHYVREATESRANHVTRRIKSAFETFSDNTLGTMLVSARIAKVRPMRKSTGLDQGVAL